MKTAQGRVELLWIAMLVIAITSTGAIVLFQRILHRLSWNLTQAKALTSTASAANRQVQAKFQALQEEHTKSEQLYQGVVTDRDNMLAQIQSLQAAQQQTEAERELLSRIIKRVSKENRELSLRVEPLEQQRNALERTQEQTARELEAARLQLAQQRSAAPHPSRRSNASQASSKDRQKFREAERRLHQMQRRLKAAESQAAKVRARLASAERGTESLKDNYTALLAENVALKHQAKRVPAEVTRLAQQHQHLLKETADMHYNLGVLFTDRRQYERAAMEFLKVIELRPDDADAYYNLGVIYAEHLPNRQKAMDCFRRYLDFNPRARDASWVKQYLASWQAWEAKERLE